MAVWVSAIPGGTSAIPAATIEPGAAGADPTGPIHGRKQVCRERRTSWR